MYDLPLQGQGVRAAQHRRAGLRVRPGGRQEVELHRIRAAFEDLSGPETGERKRVTRKADGNLTLLVN